MRCLRQLVLVTVVVALAAATGMGQPNFQVGNFDVYKYSTDGTPVPDVDKAFHGDIGSNSCW